MTEETNTSGIRAKAEFKNFLEEVDLKDLFDTKVKGKFLLIKYTQDNNREEEFLRFIFDNLPTYALTSEERSAITPKDTDKLFRLWKVAVERFVSKSQTGEFGEIVLFHLLEILEGAVQVVNKMAIKTSGEMNYHGADAIHFCLEGSCKILYLGESKTGAKFSDVLRSALSSTAEYHKEGKREFDINLASGNISPDIPEESRKAIKEYLNPCKADLSDFAESHAIFLGFQMDCLSEFEKSHHGKELVEKVIESYKKDIETYIQAIETKIKEFPELANKRFLFFVIPFKDLDALRKKFTEAVKNGKAINI